jgi:hypothetical protein
MYLIYSSVKNSQGYFIRILQNNSVTIKFTEVAAFGVTQINSYRSKHGAPAVTGDDKAVWIFLENTTKPKTCNPITFSFSYKPLPNNTQKFFKYTLQKNLKSRNAEHFH